MRELHVVRLIEAEIGANLGLFLGRRILPDHEGHRVAGEIEQSERDEGDDRQNDRRLQDPAQDESEHYSRRRAAPRRDCSPLGGSAAAKPQAWGSNIRGIMPKASGSVK